MSTDQNPTDQNQADQNQADRIWPEEEGLPTWTALSSTPMKYSQTREDEFNRLFDQEPRRTHELPPPVNNIRPPAPRRRSNHGPPKAAFLVAAGVLLVGTIFGATLLVKSDDSAAPSEEVTNTDGGTTDGTEETEGSIPLETTPPSDLAFDETPNSTEGISQSEAEADPSTAGGETGPETYRRAVFAGGVIYLRGRVPSEEIGAAIVERASAVMGPENVINEYVIDPSVPFDPDAGAPLYVEDLVLFKSGSATIAPQFVPLLDLGMVLMTQNPQVTITVIGHTDTKGNETDNLVLSQERVQAVLNYWIGAGIDPARVTVIGKGEQAPLADNSTAEGRRINRRVEFIITGLLAQ